MAITAMVKEPVQLEQSEALNETIGKSNKTFTSASGAIHESKFARIGEELPSCPAETVIGSDGKEEFVEKIESFGPKYEWESSDRSLIFEAFFWTYVLCQIPAARLAEIIGAKWILMVATVGSSILSLLSPWAASVHVYAFTLIRALMGVCQTALYPSCYVLYTRWLPPAERSIALPVLGAAAYIGSIITSTATGYFAECPSLGWEYAFYMPSIVCAVWSVFWVFIGASEPREHRFISVEEILYIESRMELKRINDNQQVTANGSSSNNKKSPSWIKIFGSQHIWAMMATFFASNWAFTITMLLIPSYLNYILQIPPFKNGIINSIIYILCVIFSPIVGAVSTQMVETRAFGLTRLQTRKLFQCTAVFGQAICFLSLPLIGCSRKLVLGVLFTQIVVFSFVNGGEVQLPSELSLDFAGTIFAIGNCVGSSTGFLVPRVHSYIVKHSRSRDEWNVYFYLAALVTFLGGLIFLLFGKNDLQDFSKNESIETAKANFYNQNTEKKESCQRQAKKTEAEKVVHTA